MVVVVILPLTMAAPKKITTNIPNMVKNDPKSLSPLPLPFFIRTWIPKRVAPIPATKKNNDIGA
jgi:hypothetical protein